MTAERQKKRKSRRSVRPAASFFFPSLSGAMPRLFKRVLVRSVMAAVFIYFFLQTRHKFPDMTATGLPHET